MLTSQQLRTLSDFAKEIRKKTLYTIGNLGVGHIGGALSIADLLALLYGKVMHIDPANPTWEDRDLLVLSKGHAGPALYATLALKGFFPLSELDTLNQGGTNLPSHCDRTKTVGIDMTTGSLGQSLSAACGLTYAGKIDKKIAYVYAFIGDGSRKTKLGGCLFLRHYKLANRLPSPTTTKMHIAAMTDDIMRLWDIEMKWNSFFLFSQRFNGHDLAAMDGAIQKAQEQSDKPSMIILDTIKGKGASFCENKVTNHNMNFDLQTAKAAIAELG